MAGRYKIKTISELCGFSPTLLRAWESRHHLLEPVRQPSGHRLYTEDDLAVLRRVSQLLAQGQSIGEIAAVGRLGLLARGAVTAHDSFKGTLVPLETLKREVLQGGLALDQILVQRALERMELLLTRREIVHSVFSALAKEIRSMRLAGRAGLASENLVTSLLRERVWAWTRQGATTDGRVLCAGFPDEPHELEVLLVNYELRESGRDCLFLGLGLSFSELELAIAVARPCAVSLSVSRPVLLQLHRSHLAEMVGRHPEVRFVVVGAGCIEAEEEVQALGAIPWAPHRSLSGLAEVLP